MSHSEENKECPQNNCGQFANCNNYACEGEHGCTCQQRNECRQCELEGNTGLSDILSCCPCGCEMHVTDEHYSCFHGQKCFELVCPTNQETPEPTQETCQCEEMTCKENCSRNHTHKTIWCEKCRPPEPTQEKHPSVILVERLNDDVKENLRSMNNGIIYTTTATPEEEKHLDSCDGDCSCSDVFFDAPTLDNQTPRPPNEHIERMVEDFYMQFCHTHPEDGIKFSASMQGQEAIDWLRTALTSRDTYWKERVSEARTGIIKTVEDTIAEFGDQGMGCVEGILQESFHGQKEVEY